MTTLRIILRSVLLVTSLSTIITAQQHGVRTAEMQRITTDATYDFANIKMYKDEEAWHGRTVAFSGFIQKTPVIVRGKRQYLQVSGQTASGAVNVIILLDAPIPTTENYGNAVPTITPGMEVRAFVQLTGLMNVTNEAGYLLNLPTGEGLLIFAKDDYSMTNPVWASAMLRR